MRSKSGAAIGVCAVTLVAGAAVAAGAIPDGDGVIHACYTSSTGALRVVGSNATCRGSESTLTWNQQGPAGPPGSSATAPVVVRYHDFFGAGQATGFARCNPGEQATGGGYDAGGNGTEGSPIISAPVPSIAGQPATGWEVTVLSERVNQSLGGRVYVVCQQVTP